MICPFCASDNLENFTEGRKELESMTAYFKRGGKITICCEDCGASFQVINKPEDILLEDRFKAIEKEGVVINDLKLSKLNSSDLIGLPKLNKNK